MTNRLSYPYPENDHAPVGAMHAAFLRGPRKGLPKVIDQTSDSQLPVETSLTGENVDPNWLAKEGRRESIEAARELQRLEFAVRGLPLTTLFSSGEPSELR